MPSKRYTWRRLLGLVMGLVLVTGYLILPVARARSIAHPPRSAVCCATPADFGHPYQEVTFPTAHGWMLRGWLVPSQNGAVVIVAHGFGGNRANFLDAGSMLADLGYGILWIDLLGHGESESSLLAFDGEDVLAAVRYLQEQPSTSSLAIGVWGFSLGGLEALQAASQTSDIRAIVADGPMPVVASEDMPLPETLADALWVPFDWVELRALAWQGIEARSSVRRALGDIAPRPILLITGAQNRGEARVVRNYAAAGGSSITLWEIPEAGHIEGWQARRDEYAQKVTNFFKQSLLDASIPTGP
jgi:fermentation-respiration switch protein FrsA (DUF1100 family)